MNGEEKEIAAFSSPVALSPQQYPLTQHTIQIFTNSPYQVYPQVYPEYVSGGQNENRLPYPQQTSRQLFRTPKQQTKSTPLQTGSERKMTLDYPNLRPPTHVGRSARSANDNPDYYYHTQISECYSQDGGTTDDTSLDLGPPQMHLTSEEMYAELQYKRPKRKFRSKEDRMRFVSTYKAKIKTELCKNWSKYGKCKFGEHCSFAHGDQQLKQKTHLPSNYRTRLCKQFHDTMYCPYGYRCQFLHTHRNPKSSLSFQDILSNNIRSIEATLFQNPKFEEGLMYVNLFRNRSRLAYFSELTGTAAPKAGEGIYNR